MTIQEMLFLYTIGKIKENSEIKKVLEEIKKWNNKLTK